MASVCMPQVSYQQHNFNMILLQQQQQQHQQHQPQQHQNSLYAKQHQRIAPAPPKILGESNLQNMQGNVGAHMGPMLQKRKYAYGHMPYAGEQLPSVARRNARERNRVKQVNNGFANLRQHLPQYAITALSHGGRGASKKLSKVDTLRIAVEYIRGLQDMLEGTHSENLNSEDSSNDDSQFDDLQLSDEHQQQYSGQQQAAYHSYHSEASASPAPSYSDSDISIGGANNYVQPLNLNEPSVEQHPSLHFKLEDFDAYDHSEQPENDEELIEYISLWQEQ